MSEDKFQDASSLEAWLKGKGVDENDVAEAANKLFSRGFNKPSRLFGITIDMLQTEGFSNPLSLELSNKLKEQPPRPNVKTNVLGDGVLDKLRLALFYFVDKTKKPIGTGFFVSPTVAVSAAHIFTESTKVGAKRTGYFGKPHLRKTCKLKVDMIDSENDFIIFCIQDGEENATEYLDLAPESLDAGDQCILAAFQLGIHGELPELGKELSVGIFPGVVVKAHERHFVYICPSFAGDSGGAIIFSNGKAVGMHIMTVNEAHELERLKSLGWDSTTGELVSHVNSVERSINSLIGSSSSGALGISMSSIMAAHGSGDSKIKFT